MPDPAITYRLTPVDPEAHLYEVVCAVAAPDPAGQRLALPAWIPGSYLIRDFARHVVSISAQSGGKELRLAKLDKHTWQAPPLAAGAALSVCMRVYAFDLSVRGAYLDRQRAFCNGSSVFLRVVGQEETPCRLDLAPPAGAAYAAWQVATALQPAHAAPGAAAPWGFGAYQAANYAELIDHPVEMGEFSRFEFSAGGVPHAVALSGCRDCDTARLSADLARICASQQQLFGAPAPFNRYLFLINAVDGGYGGLEHRASTALICARSDLPYQGMGEINAGYRSFLGLASHEYFHAWNVKRMKPAAFMPYDLTRENHTELLWFFEGFTSYYDDLTLLRAGLISADDWLSISAGNIDRVHSVPGRRVQSLAEASFDAWSKFYRQDENSANALVSYYTKGALFALALDLRLRAADATASLDQLMRLLWQRFGDEKTAVDEAAIIDAAEEISGLRLAAFFRQGVHGTADLPLARLLKPFGVRLRQQPGSVLSMLGVRIETKGDEVRLANVYSGSAAERAGLAAGDLLIALDGLRLTPAGLETALRRRRAGDTITIHAFRRDELFSCPLTLAEIAHDSHRLEIEASANRRRAAWLGSAWG